MERCKTCGNTREWHAENLVHHQFDPDGSVGLKRAEPPKSEPAEQNKARVVRGMGTDPILRATLIRKGVIDADDLAETEQMLLGSSGGIAVFTHGDAGDAQPG